MVITRYLYPLHLLFYYEELNFVQKIKTR